MDFLQSQPFRRILLLDAKILVHFGSESSLRCLHSFFIHDINFGYDLTRQYDWITDTKNISAISNSTEI